MFTDLTTLPWTRGSCWPRSQRHSIGKNTSDTSTSFQIAYGGLGLDSDLPRGEAESDRRSLRSEGARRFELNYRSIAWSWTDIFYSITKTWKTNLLLLDPYLDLKPFLPAIDSFLTGLLPAAFFQVVSQEKLTPASFSAFLPYPGNARLTRLAFILDLD